MLFTNIRLQNFRSYEDASFELGTGVNIIVGPNAAGKTNLLEALMVCAVGKSYRAKDMLLIEAGKSWLRLDVHTSENSTRIIKIEANTDTKTSKSFVFDDKPYKKLILKHRQPIVLFEPNDLHLLYAEPNKRREYIDNLLEQYIPHFAKLRLDYRRIIAQRNALLKQPLNVGKSQIFAWNLRLCQTAAEIVENRLKLIDVINESIDETYTSVSNKTMDVKVQYVSKTPTLSYSSNLMRQLEEQIDIDRIRGYTSRGPHRDDIVAYFGDKPISDSASRGENRTYMLSLKILELHILEEQTGKRPLLLLDDVFSELDGSRRRALTQFLQNYQTIITTTDADIVTQHFSDKTHKIII